MPGRGGVDGRPSAELVQRFVASLRDLHVEAHVVHDQAETKEVLRNLLSSAGCKAVVVAGIPERYGGAVRAALDGLDVILAEGLLGKPRAEVLRLLASAEAGVTWAANGLAAEGALMEVTYDDSSKLASSLPMLHLALLESSSLIRDLPEALSLVGRIIRDAPAGKKPAVSFISGPSKTGDIEMRLLYGVHGPHTVHAVLLDWNGVDR